MTFFPGTTLERGIKYAMDSCVRREMDLAVWRLDTLIGSSPVTLLPDGAKLVGTARFSGRGALWEPAA